MDDNWVLYIITDKDSCKIQNLRQNPAVAFVAGTTPIPHTVQIQGTGEIIESNNPSFDEITKKMLETKRLDKDPLYNAFGHNYVVVKIMITLLRWLFFDQSTGKAVYTVLIL